ncbi:MAG: calcium/sodium antiporter [Vicinamibacterales bacterium]|nr:calcium/sodium antiporter [Vicinamibacterales bacterium]
MPLLLIALGFALLVAGGELLVRGASRLATMLGLSPLVIGLTVVAFGTSAPELAVSVHSGLTGRPDLAVGNVVGSNIFNTLVVLGACALAAPLVVARQLTRFDVPLMIGFSLLLVGLSWDGRISTLDGVGLTLLLAAHLTWSVVQGRRDHAEAQQAAGVTAPVAAGVWAWMAQIALVVAGVALLVQGAAWLVDGASALARAVGVSELVIGLTVVAVGTSLPEVAASVVATIRGERDMAVGNVVGSNIFNLLGILGIASVVTPGGLPVASALFAFDIPVMTVAAFACLPVFARRHELARWEGAVFLAYYIAYLGYVMLKAVEHDALPVMSGVLFWFVAPLTMVTLAVLTWRVARR